jgi:hypothetical protein
MAAAMAAIGSPEFRVLSWRDRPSIFEVKYSFTFFNFTVKFCPFCEANVQRRTMVALPPLLLLKCI